MFGINLKEFHLPTLPNELTNFVGNISDKAGDVFSTVKAQSKRLTSKIIPESEKVSKSENEKPIDFLSLAGINGIDEEFGGVMELPGSYTTEYKRPCKDITEYDAQTQLYIDGLRKSDAESFKLFHKIGTLLNYNDSHNGVFIKRNARVSCSPKHINMKLERRSKKAGEKCRSSQECIGKKTKCKKPVNGRYVAGICREPLVKGEGIACKKSDDCPSGLVCDRNKCTKKLDREKTLKEAAARDKGKIGVELKDFSGIRGEKF
tara:strand:+ start:323 stop:1108 length:786 start_codon:yes stop_codon:yes gene_type:complete